MYIPEAIKAFLTEFCESNENGAKFFKYASQLVNIAHREQVSEYEKDHGTALHCFAFNLWEFLVCFN